MSSNVFKADFNKQVDKKYGSDAYLFYDKLAHSRQLQKYGAQRSRGQTRAPQAGPPAMDAGRTRPKPAPVGFSVEELTATFNPTLSLFAPPPPPVRRTEQTLAKVDIQDFRMSKEQEDFYESLNFMERHLGKWESVNGAQPRRQNMPDRQAPNWMRRQEITFKYDRENK